VLDPVADRGPLWVLNKARATNITSREWHCFITPEPSPLTIARPYPWQEAGDDAEAESEAAATPALPCRECAFNGVCGPQGTPFRPA